MKNAKIVLVAEWDGWCGACAAERPLVLTRTGRQRLRTWLTAADDDSRPLLLTCRLCGTGVAVPLERDDPPVISSAVEPEPLVAVQAATSVAAPVAVEPATSVAAPHEAPTSSVAGPAPGPAAAAPELVAGRQAVARALGGLLAQRSAATPASPALAPGLVTTPVVAAALPQQRTPATGGLAELQLLADGIDLLSTGRA